MENKKTQKMRVSWIPQVGADIPPFYIPVTSVEEAKKVMDILAAYDLFQYGYRIKPDFCNSGYVEVWNEKDQTWDGWEYDGDAGYFDDIDEYIEEESPAAEEIAAFNKELFGQLPAID